MKRIAPALPPPPLQSTGIACRTQGGCSNELSSNGLVINDEVRLLVFVLTHFLLAKVGEDLKEVPIYP